MKNQLIGRVRGRLALPALLALLHAGGVAAPQGQAAGAGAAGPRYTLRLSAERAAPPPRLSGSLQFSGERGVLIRYQGLTIFSDPAALPEPPPAVDLVVLSHFHPGHIERLARQNLARATPIVCTGQSALALRALGFRNLYIMETWDAIHVNKGAARLRLTALPGRAGAALLPAGTMDAMLDIGDGKGAAYRIYLSGDSMQRGDSAAIPRRLPGADLALLHPDGGRLLGVETAADGVINYLRRDEVYPFKARKR